MRNMEWTFKTKQRLTTVTQSIFFLLGGIEYAVVLPTLNAYIGSLGGDAMFFGIIMASFSLSGLLISPIYGLIQDRTQRTKALVLFANLWEIGGNFLYFVGGSKYVLLGSRLIAGVGGGVGSALYAQIAMTTTEKDRAAALSVAAAARQIGLVVGPGLNLPLSFCDFYIGPFHVNSFSGPGLLMCCLWVCLEVIMVFCFFDIVPLTKQTTEREAGHDTKDEIDDDNDDSGGPLSNSAASINDGPTRRLVGGRAPVNNADGFEDVSLVAVQDPPTPPRWSVFLKEEVVVLLAAQFVFMFNQTCLETALTVMTKRLMDFTGFENSILYAVAGVELLVCFIIIKFISRFITDRTMLLGALTLELLITAMFIVFYPNAVPGLSNNLWWFSTIFVIQVSGLAFFAISIVSLYSKITPLEMQGFCQGIRRSVLGLGTVMGPLWAGCIEHWPYETLAVMVGLFALLWGMIMLSWKQLRPHSDLLRNSEDGRALPSDNSNGEAKPLLGQTDTRGYGVA